LHKAVPGFGDIGRRIDGASELLITDELEEKERPHHTPQFTEGDIEFVLAAIVPSFRRIVDERMRPWLMERATRNISGRCVSISVH
jgi:hypothetical protein